MTAMPPEFLRMAAQGRLSMAPDARIVVGNPDEQREAKLKRKRRTKGKQAKQSRKANRGR